MPRSSCRRPLPAATPVAGWWSTFRRRPRPRARRGASIFRPPAPMPDLGFLIPADKLVEPTLLVTADGDVLSANMAAAEEFGRHQRAWSLVELTAGGGAQLRSYLALCAVSADPIPGALTLQDGRDFRVDGFVLRPASAERAAALCLRLRLRTESNAS